MGYMTKVYHCVQYLTLIMKPAKSLSLYFIFKSFTLVLLCTLEFVNIYIYVLLVEMWLGEKIILKISDIYRS